MPTPPAFDYNVGKRPLASYFGLPANAAQDTRFGPEASALLQEGADYNQAHVAQQAEMAANDLLGNAGQMTDEELNQQLVQNPRLFGTQAVRPLGQYMQFRQSTTPMADQQLGPVLERKITDPRHREIFRKRMLDDGMSAYDAFEEYRRDEYNDQYSMDLAEAGVTDDEFRTLQTPTGLFDPTLVARRVARAKAEAKKGPGKATPLDEEIEVLADALTRTEKAWEAATDKTTKELLGTRRQSYMDRLSAATDEKLSTLRPASAAPAPSTKPSSFLQKALGISEIPVTEKTPEQKVTKALRGF